MQAPRQRRLVRVDLARCASRRRPLVPRTRPAQARHSERCACGRVSVVSSRGCLRSCSGWLAGVVAAHASPDEWLAVGAANEIVRTAPVAEQWQMAAVRLSRRLHIATPVKLLESTLVDVPTVIGWLKPVMLLPASALAGLAPAQLEAIFAHELAHVRRHDYLVNLLQTVVETLLFYHPAVWWLSARIRAERENCCDDLAVALCGDPVAYARALADLEELRGTGGRLVMAANGALARAQNQPPARGAETHRKNSGVACRWTGARAAVGHRCWCGRNGDLPRTGPRRAPDVAHTGHDSSDVVTAGRRAIRTSRRKQRSSRETRSWRSARTMWNRLFERATMFVSLSATSTRRWWCPPVRRVPALSRCLPHAAFIPLQ